MGVSKIFLLKITYYWKSELLTTFFKDESIRLLKTCSPPPHLQGINPNLNRPDLFRQGSDEKNLINEDPERPEDRDQVNHHPEPDRPSSSLPSIQVSNISDKYDGIGTNPPETGRRRDSHRLVSDLMNEYSTFSEILPPPTHPEISRWKIKSNGFKTETN